MRRTGVFVFIAAGLLLAGAVVLWLGSGGETDGGASAALAGAARSSEPDGFSALPASRTPDAAPESASLEAVDSVVEVAAQDALPASYRKALGGLTGRILEHTPGESDTLRPVANLKVELAGGRKSSIFRPRDALLDPSQLEAQFILGSTVTGSDGRFLLEHIDPRTMGALLLDPGGPRGMFWPLEVTPASGVTNDLGDLVLPATATLFGTIVDERSAPVPGARVRATDLPLPEAFVGVAEFRSGGGVLLTAEATDGAGDRVFLPPPSLSRLESRLPVPTTFTDDEGKYELTGVPPGLVVMVVDDGVHLPLARTGVPTGAAGGRRDVGPMTVGDGLPLRVKVRTSDGKEVPAPQVFAGSQLPGAPVAVMKTPNRLDDDGSARFTGLPSGKAWVAARADGRHDFTVLSLPEVSVGEATITLQTPHDLTLTVRDCEGAAVTNAAFFARSVTENETPDFILPPFSLADRTQGGDKGRYVVSDLEPLSWEITTIVAGQPQHRLNVDLSAGDASAEVRLARGHGAAVRVVSAGDGAPIEYALVEAYPEDDAMELKLFDGPTSAERTDAQGLASFSALPPGPVKFSVNHPGFAVTDGETSLPADGELRIALSAGGSIAGQVLDRGAAPAEPLLVMLAPEGAPGDAELPRFLLTDREGHFRFARVEAGTVEVQVRSRMEVGAGMSLFETMFNSPLAETEVEVIDGQETEVLLQVGGELEGTETGFITGQLTVNGAQASGWKVRTWGKIRRSVSTDSNGNFDMGRVAAGEVNLLVSAPSQNIGNGFTDTLEIELKAGEQKWVPIDLTAGAITGRVVSAANGEPLAGAEVTASDSGETAGWNREPSTITAPDGSFTIDPVVTGRYSVRARADGFAQASSEPMDVSAFQTRTGIVLRLPAALVVSGTIVLEGATEKPEWMWLMATGGDGGNGREGARIDSGDLTYSFARLGPGEWNFELSTSLEMEFESVKVTLTGDRKDLKLIFKPVPPDPPETEGDGEGEGAATVTFEVK